ncbi:MAG: MFS transporter, partial [Enterococcus sp.]
TVVFKKFLMRKQLIISIVILLFLTLGFSKFFYDLKTTSVRQITEHWSFFVKDRSDHLVFGESDQRIKDVEPNHSLIMQQILESPLKHPELAIRANHQWVSVYLEDQLLYQYAASKRNPTPGLLQTTLHLPEGYQQKKVRIITNTPYEYYAGIPAQVFIGEKSEISRYFVLRSIPQLILFVVCLSSIIAALVLLFLRRKPDRQRIMATLLLVSFIFLIGFQSIVLNIPASTLFSPTSLSLIYNLTSILIPICLTNYYLLRTKRYHRFYLAAIVLQFFLLFAGLIFTFINQLSVPVSMQVFNGFHVFLTLYTATIALAESANQNHFYVVCSPAIVIAAFIHCFFYIQLFAGAANLTIDWPLILFSLLMFIICSYHFSEDLAFLREQVNRQQEENQKTIIRDERQQNLLQTFKLLAQQESGKYDQLQSLEHVLQHATSYYQKEFSKRSKFFTYQIKVPKEHELLRENSLLIIIQLLENFLIGDEYGAVDITVQEQAGKLVIESSTNVFTRHSFAESIHTETTVEHQSLKHFVKSADGQWHWEDKDNEHYFKITLSI